MFDEDILDENNEVNDIHFQSKRGGRTNQKVVQPKNQSAFDYGDLEFSEEDNGKKQGGMKNSSLHKPGKFEDSLGSLVMQQKQEQQSASRQLSALPPIQQNNNSSMLTAKAKQSQKSSKILDEEYDGKLARINTGKKKEEPKKKQDDDGFDDLDDLEDIYAQNQKESQIKKQGQSVHSSLELPTQKQKPIEEEKREQDKDEGESENYEDDYEKDDFEQDEKKQKEHSDKESELSDLPELQYEEKHPKKVENNESSNRKEAKGQKDDSAPAQRRSSGSSVHNNYGKNDHKEKNSKPPQQQQPSSRTNSQSQSRQRTHNNSQQKKFALLNMDNLEDLLVERQYDSMSLHQIKAENEQLREKLREFNRQLTDKVEHSQAFLSQQASQQGSEKYHRSRSSQMRTADAETENDNKIMKRLREELERLQQRLRVLEDPSYVSTLKLQIETSKSLINKFRLQIKQISFKNDQQSKELERIAQEGGVHESVREGYILKQDVQQSLEKLNEMQNRKEELEDLFARKNDLLKVKEEEYNKKHDEALALGVNMNFSSAELKKREKYQELLKNLEQWEKSNATLTKMNKTREGAMLKELDSVLKFIQEKDSQINEVENEIITSQGAVQDRVDNEKLYSRNVKELLGRLDNAENHSLQHNDDNPFRENNSSIESTAHKPTVNNLVSPRPLKISSKPNMKFTKVENGSPPSPTLQKNPQNEVTATPNESEKGINFHKKIQNRQDVSSDREEQPTGVSSKPFSLKKGSLAEQRVWKPQEEDNIKPSAEQANKGDSTQGAAKSFNFKHKNDVLNSDASQNAPQQYLLPQKILNSEEQSEPSENSSFSKPPMFKFKKTETIMEKNNSNNTSDLLKMTDSQPSQDQLLQQPKQQQVSSLLGEDKDNDDIGFSMNSRLSKNRAAKGKNQQSDTLLQAQQNPIQTKLSNIQEEEKPSNTQGSLAYQGVEQNKDLGLGGYQFSAMKEQPSGVTRRRGQNNKEEEKNAYSDLIGGGYQPSSNANKPTQNIGQDLNVEKKENDADDDFGNNIKSRRGRNHQIKKDQDETDLNLFGMNDNIKPFVPKVGQVDNKLNTDNVQKKQPDNEWDFGSLVNPSVAPQKTGLNNNINNNVNSIEEKQGEAPKTFNFKKNQQANAVSPDKPQESQPIKTELKNETAQNQVQPSNIERNRGGVQGNQVKPEVQKKDDDDVLFMGPSERRRAKKPNVQDQGANPKVIKREVFQDNDTNAEQPFNFAAPKEVGITSTNQQQNRLQPNRIAEDSEFGTKKKSALDDDLDGEDGLEFLKEKKQKVNYNDDDDDIFGAKPSKLQQAAPAIQKKTQEKPQAREKKLVSNEDFFNDLM